MAKRTLEFAVKGMHCASCSSRIERTLGAMPDVESVSVSLATDTAQVVPRPDAAPEALSEAVITAVSTLGFTAEALDLPSSSTKDTPAAALSPAEGKRTLDLAIKGMHCAACSSRIERVVGGLPDVASVSVSLASNTARLEFTDTADPATAVAGVLSAITPLGFSAEVLTPAGDGADALSEAARRWEKRTREQQAELMLRKRDLLPAFAFALPLLILSMGEMAGMPLPAVLDPRHSPLAFASAQLVLCLPVLWSGRRFFLQGLPALWRRSPNMDSLVALGTGAAFLFSLWNTVSLILLGKTPSLLPHAMPGQEGTGMAAEAAVPAQSALTGFWDMLFGTGHAAYGVDLYYESAAVVIALVSLGKYLESRSRLRTSEALKGLLDLAPETAVRVRSDGSEESVPLAQVTAGDIVRIRPGGRVPVDGVVVDGASFVDESMLTGESMPVEKKAGDSLAGGTMNQQGVLSMRAERVGADTVLARIVRLVQEAQGSKAPIAGLADRVSFYFVPAVMALAVLAGLFWWWYDGSGSFALRIFVSVMVIACPCAMGLATPMSIMVGTGRGAQFGVLFKNGSALELSSRITAMVFDKTGTLTAGSPALIAVRRILDCPEEIPVDGGTPAERDRLLAMAASLEASSEHPLALALVRGAKDKGLTLLPVENFIATPGKGVSGTLLTGAGPLAAAVGNAAFAREMTRLPSWEEPSSLVPDAAVADAAVLSHDPASPLTPDADAFVREQSNSPLQANETNDRHFPETSVPASHETDSQALHGESGLTDLLEELIHEHAVLGQTPVILLLAGAPVAVFAVADPLRPESASTIGRLKDMGIRCIMLTGDNAVTANAVARQVDIDQVVAGVLPDGKAEAVAELQRQGHVVGMVGDGINDAPALAKADVGFAMNSGIDVAVETGDVVLMRHGLAPAVAALALGRATMRNIRENLFWAFAYNIIGIPFAAGLFHLFGGPVLSPMLAGAAMALSSVSVVGNALRLRFFTPPDDMRR